MFFVCGMRFQGNSPSAQRGRELLREMVARGHAVGNHTVHHHFLCGSRGAKIAALEIGDNARLIEEAIGIRPELFRTPYGSHCRTLSSTLERLGLSPVGWDIDPQDWKVQDTRRVRDFVVRRLRRLQGRQILLLHDIHENTVRALPQVLEWLERENAARIARDQLPVRIIDYTYLLPQRLAVPPILDAIGRLLIGAFARPLPFRWLWSVAGSSPRS